MEHLSLYFEFYKIKLKSIVAYRKMFIWTTFAKFSSYIASFLVIWIMVQAFETIGTWNAYEVMFLYGMDSAAYSICGAFFYHVCTYLDTEIQKGTLNEILTKPLNPLLFLMAQRFSIGYFGTFLASFGIMIYTMVRLDISINVYKLLFLFISVIFSALLMAGIWLICAVPSFWTVKSGGFKYIIFGQGRNFTRYPLSIYNKFIQIVLTIILPFGFINFYPSQYFLQKNDFMMFHPIFQYLLPLIALLIFFIAYRFWVYGINKYTGTGS